MDYDLSTFANWANLLGSVRMAEEEQQQAFRALASYLERLEERVEELESR